MVLCVNNLGALSCLEIAVVSKAAVHCLGEAQVAQLILYHIIDVQHSALHTFRQFTFFCMTRINNVSVFVIFQRSVVCWLSG